MRVDYVQVQGTSVCCGCCLLTPLNRLVFLQSLLLSPFPFLSMLDRREQKKKGYKLGKNHIVPRLSCLVWVSTSQSACWRSAVALKVTICRCSAKNRGQVESSVGTISLKKLSRSSLLGLTETFSILLCFVGDRVYTVVRKTYLTMKYFFLWKDTDMSRGMLAWAMKTSRKAALFLGSMVSWNSRQNKWPRANRNQPSWNGSPKNTCISGPVFLSKLGEKNQ